MKLWFTILIYYYGACGCLPVRSADKRLGEKILILLIFETFWYLLFIINGGGNWESKMGVLLKI